MKSLFADLTETERVWFFGVIATLLLGLFFSLPTY